MDRQFLSAWVQPQHLDEHAIRASREAFAGHPARLVVLARFLLEPIAERLNRFLATEAEYRIEHGLYSVEDRGVSEQDWLAAADQDRFFRIGKLVGTPPQYQMSPNALTYLRFRKAFQDPRLKGFFEEITDLPLGLSDDFGSHAMRKGDFLRPHSDDNRGRRLALVLYLTPDWGPAFGGALHMVDSRERVTKIDAEYNSVIAFDVLAGTTHFVAPVEPAAGDRVRLTIGGWYHAVA